MFNTKRRSLRLATVGAVGAAAVALATVPAFAKGELDITVTPRTVAVGQTVKVAASGSDDAAPYLLTCVEERINGKGAWRAIECGKLVATGYDAKVNTSVKAEQRGTLQFRAVLYGYQGAHDEHPVKERTTAVQTVTVR
ncbi:hypothetical protein ACWIG3_20445 [Streptomyces celluloflavus]|uniref:Proteinase inhibitor I42 chagasin domain-containing protein n=1 Tax=Streptomyces kasugaensis TaxID=1946 RepID=A0A4Q9HTS8_STRKA|nr:hypothetical protein [Streptomyces kasugaensis]TBO57889.1 hypothetical protein EYS09_20295 [Streptomyces kasugaensis]